MNTSSIEDLPTDPSISQTTSAVNEIAQQQPQNVVIQTNEKPNNVSFSSDNIQTQFENELKMAVNSGNTALPSRDIPSDTTPITNDNQVQPNYIPNPENNVDYVQNYENSNSFLQMKEKEINQDDNSDFVYEQLKIPILLGFIYFIFQMPFFKDFFYKNAPALFNNDGNYNLYGYVGTSLLFGCSFYLITFLLDYYGNL